MSKKSSKTSHVLNLLTNRTGAVIDGEADQEQSQSAPADGESGGSTSIGGSAGGELGGGASIGGSAGGELGGGASAGREPGGENTSASGFSGGASLSGGSPTGGGVGLPNPFLVEIAAPVRIAVSNPVIAELTGESALHRASSAFPEETPQKKPEEKAERKNQSVTDLIQMELERNYHREQRVPPQQTSESEQQMPSEQQPTTEQQMPPSPQTPEAEQASPAEENLTPPHIEEFTPDEFAEPDEAVEAVKAEKTDEAKTAAAGAKKADEAKTAAAGTEKADEAKTAAAGAEKADEAKTAAAGAEKADGAKAAAAEAFQPCYINVMDEIVRSNVLPIMESLEMCTCSRCVNDVVALALNLLPPKYVVTEKGSLYAKVSLYEGQHKVDVLSSITKACLEVNRNPRHHLTH